MKRLFLLAAALFMTVLAFGYADAQAKDPGRDFVETPRIPSIRGRIREVRLNADSLVINPIIDGRTQTDTQIIRVSPLTKIYYKKAPRQLEPMALRGKLSDFKVGDLVIVTAENTKDRIVDAANLWDIRSFLIYTGQISTEKELLGTVESVDRSKNIMTLKDLTDKKTYSLVADINTEVHINDRESKFNEIRPGSKIYARVRWYGYDEDRPDELMCVEIKDDITHVIHTMRGNFGPVIARGKVIGIDMKNNSIKIADESGASKTVYFASNTKWILGSQLKSPESLVGATVFAFGKPAKEKNEVAEQVINEVAMPALFEYLVESGGRVSGERALLALGECISVDSSRISVMVKGGQRVVMRVHQQAFFVKGGKQVTVGAISPGDWVKVEGILTPEGQDNIALIITSFGKAPQNLRDSLKEQ